MLLEKIKFILLGISFVSLLLGNEIPQLYNTSLLSNNGKMLSNTLSPAMAEERYGVHFDGEVELTGVLEMAYEFDQGAWHWVFYPDSNLKLPFAFDPYKQGVYNEQLKKWDYKNASFNEKTNFGVLVGIDEVYRILPYDLHAKEIIFGAVAVRAQVVLKGYGFDGTRDFPLRVGHIMKFKALSPISKHYYDIGVAPHLQKLPKTKDSYINLRGKPKDDDGKKAGEIITQIQVEDLKNKRAFVYRIDDYAIGKWLKVFYFPPSAKSGRDAISGYIHSSQIESKKQK